MLRLVAAILVVVPVVFLSSHSNSQLADTRMGACPERGGLNEIQQSVIGGLAALGDPMDAYFVMRADPTIEYLMKSCARNIYANVCTDKLLTAILGFDKFDAAMVGAGAIIIGKNKGRPSVLGGALAKGIGGPIRGAILMAQCRKTMEVELMPAAREAFEGWTIDPKNVRRDEVQQLIADALYRRRITPEQAEMLFSFSDGVTQALAK